MIEYDKWMKDTHSLIRARSEKLKALDERIKQRNVPETRKALEDWIFSQRGEGKNWRESVRNEKGVVSQLYYELKPLVKRKLDDDEMRAMTFIANAQEAALAKQFTGRRLQFKSDTLGGLLKSSTSKWQTFKDKASLLDNGRNFAKGAAEFGPEGTPTASITELLKEICEGLDVSKVLDTLHLTSFVHDAAPIFGLVRSGGKACAGWAKVVKAEIARRNVRDSRLAFAPGDPVAALEAVIHLIQRERNTCIREAGVKTGVFAGKLGASFADAGAISGPVIAGFEMLAEVVETIYQYARDSRELIGGNKLLDLGVMNLELFGASPLLGCYFISMQDHSTIVNFAVMDYGTEGWMDEVEFLAGKAREAAEEARGLIHASRYEIPEFINAKGVVMPDFAHKTGMEKAIVLSGKVTNPYGTVGQAFTSLIDRAFRNKTSDNAAKLGRIRGIGHNSAMTIPPGFTDLP